MNTSLEDEALTRSRCCDRPMIQLLLRKGSSTRMEVINAGITASDAMISQSFSRAIHQQQYSMMKISDTQPRLTETFCVFFTIHSILIRVSVPFKNIFDSERNTVFCPEKNTAQKPLERRAVTVFLRSLGESVRSLELSRPCEDLQRNSSASISDSPSHRAISKLESYAWGWKGYQRTSSDVEPKHFHRLLC